MLDRAKVVSSCYCIRNSCRWTGLTDGDCRSRSISRPTRSLIWPARMARRTRPSDTQQCLAAYHDAAFANIDPLEHFLSFGIHEGRSPFGDGARHGSGTTRVRRGHLPPRRPYSSRSRRFRSVGTKHKSPHQERRCRISAPAMPLIASYFEYCLPVQLFGDIFPPDSGDGMVAKSILFKASAGTLRTRRRRRVAVVVGSHHGGPERAGRSIFGSISHNQRSSRKRWGSRRAAPS